MNTTFDSKSVKPATTVFAFGLDASDWDRAAEDAMFADALERGVVMECGPLPAPVVEPEPADAGAYEAPNAVARAWWADNSPANRRDYAVVGEPVRATRKSRPARPLSPAAKVARQRAEDELRWADHLERQVERDDRRRRMEAEADAC